jgi:hypothetical protein
MTSLGIKRSRKYFYMSHGIKAPGFSQLPLVGRLNGEEGARHNQEFGTKITSLDNDYNPIGTKMA